MSQPILDDAGRRFIESARTATLATIAPDGRPRLVPVCFVLGETADNPGRPVLHVPLDEKPKRSDDPRRLARVRDIVHRPDVTLLFDRWSEDWSRLAWLRAEGTAEILEPGDEAGAHAAAVTALREKYPQYCDQAIDLRPMIRITVLRAIGWGEIGP